MTKTIVQFYVENPLKMLKALKTRTALIMNGQAELRLSSARQSADAQTNREVRRQQKEKFI